jgi:hypothetical protein
MNMVATQHHLDWFRVDSRERSYQLRVGQQEWLSLTWQTIRGTCATAQTHSERWTYTCVGYLSRLVIVQSALTGKTLATFKPGSGGGVLRFIDGRSYILRTAQSTHLEMLWQDHQGKIVVRFNGDFGFDTKSGGVELADDSTQMPFPDTELLISLGWYLLVSSRLDMSVIL